MIKTEFGNVRINSKGYYQVTSTKEGNHNKMLHRLVWEDHYGIIPDGCVIHHKDGNKLNNDIHNLEIMDNFEHNQLHKSGQNNPMYSKNHSLKSKLKMTHSHNKSGYYRVYKQKAKSFKRGFRWVYEVKEDGKRTIITSVDLEKLKEKVKSQGFPWIKLEKKGVD